jgi:phosphatidylserine decarboxylase
VKRDKWLIIPDVWPLLIIFLILMIIVYFLGGRKIVLVPFILFLFILYFFRNPPRKTMARSNEIVSPADGVVLAVEEVKEENYLRGSAVKVSIFLNIFNVHVNRVPITGVIDYLYYHPGSFIPAFKEHASQLNERNYVGIRCDDNPSWAVLVVQITGFIARRIVCWAKTGEKLAQGDLLGMIKFGSCTELYLPNEAIVLVKKGQKVRGGETIIGRFADNE